ncbi:MAG: NAD-dependent DNA ligase LigA [Myxococcota bacterium]
MDPETAPPRPPDKPADRMTVDELAAAVRYHNWRYFTLAEPEISDYAFDRLTRRLQGLAPDHPVLRELVTDVASGEKVFHDVPMLSLDKVYDQAELDKWLAGREREDYEGLWTESPKVDGVAASFKYDETGRLVQAATRGDGARGEVFTANARYIGAIPKQLDGGPLDGPVEVRGELYLRWSVFRALEGDFTSPRNTTAGAIKQKDPQATARYGLEFFAYDVLGPAFATETDKLGWAADRGFETVDTRTIPAAEIQAGYERWVAAREHLDFEIDGVVYKFDDIPAQRRVGRTSHHPSYAVAYKFPGDSGKSTLERIEWSVSRTGTITPVAIIDPIELSGAVVTRCSLHNLTVMEELGIQQGATVVAMRRGGVIPHIEAVAEPGVEPVQIPTECPSCGAPTRVRRNEQVKGGEVERVVEVLTCTDPLRCPDAVRGTLQHFTAQADIDGFGPKMVQKLLDAGKLRTPADFYALTADDLLELEGVGPVLANKLVGNIRSRRTLPLEVFLRGLGVENVGDVMARLLAQQFRSLDRVLELEVEDLVALEGFQETLARAVVEGLRERRPLVDALRRHVTVEDYHAVESLAAEAGDSPISGRSFVFTGKLATMNRKDAQRLVREHGGTTPTGVTKTLDYLVIGDEGSPLLGEGTKSTKHAKAEKHVAAGAPIRIIAESTFQRMLEGEAPDA